MSLMAGALCIGSSVATNVNQKSCVAFHSISYTDSSAIERISLNRKEHLSGLSSSSSSSFRINLSSKSASLTNLPAVNNVYKFSFGN